MKKPDLVWNVYLMSIKSILLLFFCFYSNFLVVMNEETTQVLNIFTELQEILNSFLSQYLTFG